MVLYKKLEGNTKFFHETVSAFFTIKALVSAANNIHIETIPSNIINFFGCIPTVAFIG
jgi:hypothetical protein